MKKLLLLALGCSFILNAADVLLERFDSEKIYGKIQDGGVIAPSEGLEGGALKVTGKKKRLQYFYTYPINAAPGEELTWALNFKTNAAMKNNTLIGVIVFTPLNSKDTIPSIYYRFPSSPKRWMHRQFTFKMPANAKSAELMLRLDGASSEAAAWIDFLRMAPVKDGIARGIDLEKFDCAFDPWKFDSQLIFDHFMPGSGGKVKLEWREAKVGEAYFEARGDKSAMQYALYIDNIRVKPMGNYIFEGWYKATENFKYNACGILIFFYKDASGKAIGQSRFHIRNTKDWKKIIHAFTVPANCAFVDIGLNMRDQSEKDIIKLDDIHFRQAADKVELRSETDSKKNVAVFSSVFTGSVANAKVKKAVYSIIDSNGKSVETVAAESNAAISYKLDKLGDGVYFIQGKFELADGKILETNKHSFGVFKKREWSNDWGIQKPSDNPPEPWKKLQPAGDGKIAFWNGIISFDNKNLMPVQISAANQNLLKTAAVLEINGKPVVLKDVKWNVMPSLAKAEGKGADGELKYTVSAAFDYIGFIRYDVTLQGGSVNDVAIRLPVKDITYLSRTDGSWTNVGSKMLPAGSSWETSHHYDNVATGNLDRGISLFTPKLYPAQSEQSAPWLKINHSDGLKADFICKKLQLKPGEKYTVSFAICAYPYRPAEANWRRLRFRAGKYSNFNLIWQTDKMFKYAGALAVTDDQKRVDDYMKHKAQYQLFYQIPLYILEKIPAWDYYKDVWKASPSRAYDMGKGLGPLTKGNYRERSWRDLYIKCLVEQLRKNPWDGVYYDCFGSDIFKENGESFYPLFDLKDFQERIYNAQRIPRKTLTVVHAGADQTATQVMYANVILMGEQYRSAFSKAEYYSQFMSMEQFLYENAVNIGPDRMLLPQYRHAWKTKSPKTATHVVGMALLHNLMLYPNFISKQTELSIRYKLYDFGLENAEFHPYWKNNGIATGNKNVYASYYSNPKGKVVIVLNYSAEKANIAPKFPFEIKNAKVFNPVDGKETAYSGKLEIDGNMMQMILSE